MVGMAVQEFEWGRERKHISGLAVAEPTITSVTSVSKVGDADWCELWGEWVTFNIAGLDPSRPARLNVKLVEISGDHQGGAPLQDTGQFNVDVNGAVGIMTLSTLKSTSIVIPAERINPDGSTWVRVYGTPDNFHIPGIESSAEQNGAPREGDWFERNRPLVAAGAVMVAAVMAAVLVLRH